MEEEEEEEGGEGGGGKEHGKEVWGGSSALRCRGMGRGGGWVMGEVARSGGVGRLGGSG